MYLEIVNYLLIFVFECVLIKSKLLIVYNM